MWREAVDGLGAACDGMKERAQRSLGPYFVFCQNTHSICVSIDTSVAELRDAEHRESA